ncbi:MAG: UDP-N-acetylmuramoyl-L-alanyl-D-glutamate--2,6-diaminopimelate ligase [Candidatus Hydrogenedentota bacterium]
MITLRQLPLLLRCEGVCGSDAEVTGVTERSDRVRPGTVFVAAQGTRVDGHEFAADAAQRGAVAILGARSGLAEFCGLPYFFHPHPRQALGLLAHAIVSHPTQAVRVSGITGTNGKTSTALMAQHVLGAAGYSTAFAGTVWQEIAGERREALLTTPMGEDLAAFFAEARAAGVTHAVMEVSSIALEQHRVAGIHFSAAAFTNLTQDHLDYHGNMEAYLKAKLLLFEGMEGGDRFTVVNREDPSADVFIRASRVPCYTYGAGGDCRAVNVKYGEDATRFMLESPWGQASIELRLLGQHNVSNALCAIALSLGQGVGLEQVENGIRTFDRVPGRFDAVNAGQPFKIVVDYAHTDDGLRNVLLAARGVCRGRVIVVFGCGGDRDKGKRPKMGKVAGELSDFAIITSDNPRTEDPETIVLDIEVGMQQSGKSKYQEYLTIVDRREAIREAIARARPGDLVLIAGKGHENYQILGSTKLHFDDREEAIAVIQGH